MVEWEYKDAFCPYCKSITPCVYNQLNEKYLCGWCNKTFKIMAEDTAGTINIMLDEMVDDIKWLIKFALRHILDDDEKEEIKKIERKYFGL